MGSYINPVIAVTCNITDLCIKAEIAAIIRRNYQEYAQYSDFPDAPQSSNTSWYGLIQRQRNYGTLQGGHDPRGTAEISQDTGYNYSALPVQEEKPDEPHSLVYRGSRK